MDAARLGFAINPFDNMLAVSADGRTFHTRIEIEDARIGEDWLFSRWHPMDGVAVETWLIARPPFHIRVHRLTIDRPLYVTEGGFAIERTDEGPRTELCQGSSALIVTADAASFAIALFDDARAGFVRRAHPNSSLYFPQTYVPHLSGRLEAGTHTLAAAFVASTAPDDAQTWPANVPDAPTQQ